MDELTQSLKREGSSRFGFLDNPLASLAGPSVAVWAPIPLRLVVGYGFMEHGYAKLARGSEAFAAILHAMNVPAPHFMAWLTMLTVHLPYGFSSVKLLSVASGRAQFGPPGYELDLLYLACLAALVIGGCGPVAIDNYLRKKRWPRW